MNDELDTLASRLSVGWKLIDDADSAEGRRLFWHWVRLLKQYELLHDQIEPSHTVAKNEGGSHHGKETY